MKGKWLFLTGATGSVGSVIAARFASSGCNVILCDVDGQKCDLLAKSLGSEYAVNTLPICCNLEMIDDRFELVGKLKDIDAIDVLINNAAFVGDSELPGWAGAFEKQSIETWRRALEISQRLFIGSFFRHAFTKVHLRRSLISRLYTVRSVLTGHFIREQRWAIQRPTRSQRAALFN